MSETLSDGRLTESELKKWHEDNLKSNELFCDKVKILLGDIIAGHDIPIHDIDGRVKGIDSLLKKFNEKGYESIDKITDIVGTRIITLIPKDVDKICDLIKENFEVDEGNSSDKSKELKENETGYQSVHYIVKLNPSRYNLLEWSAYKDRIVEIQIRTLLQHAWATMSHDSYYKFPGAPSSEIRRRIHLTSAALELIDLEFQRSSEEVVKYKNEVSEDVEKGNLDIELNSTSIAEYLNKNFNDFVDWPSFRKSFDGFDYTIIRQLKAFGINSIADLNEIMPEIFSKKERIRIHSYPSFLINVMRTNDRDRYFSVARDHDDFAREYHKDMYPEDKTKKVKW